MMMIDEATSSTAAMAVRWIEAVAYGAYSHQFG
jgi:hypothetical protein